MLPTFSLLRPRLLSPLTLSTITLTTTSLALLHPSSPFSTPSLRYHLYPTPLLCDSPALSNPHSAKPSTATNSRSKAHLFKQISLGSILGVSCGIIVGAFSRTLALLLGMSIVGAQWLASKGLSFGMEEKARRYVGNVDVQKWVTQDVAFKVAFGACFGLAGWGAFD
jgi:uncharacterized membrane protein (Fun14 family)